MGYYLIQQPEPPTAQQIATAAVLAFQQFHTVECKPTVTIDAVNNVVKVEAGETMMFTWEELGF